MSAEFLHARRRELFGGFLLGFILAVHSAEAGQGVGQRRIAITWTDSADQLTRFGSFQAAAPWTQATQGLVVPAHCRIRFSLGRLFLISPDTDEVLAIDPIAWTIDQTYSMDQGLRPIDLIVLDPNNALIACRGSSHLLNLNLLTGAVTPAIDLSVYADDDGSPEAEALSTLDGRLYVSMQRLDSKSGFPALPPAIGVIDLATQMPVDADAKSPGVQPIILQGTAPHGKMQMMPSTQRLFLKSTGFWMDFGGLEMVNPLSLQSEGLIIAELIDAASEIGAFVILDHDNGYFVDSTDLLLSSHLHRFTISGGSPTPDEHTELNYLSQILIHEPSNDLVFMPVPDGVHAFDAPSAKRLTEEVVPFNLPADMASYVVGCGTPADANGDGQINGLDVQTFVDCVVNGGLGCPCLDLDGGGRTDSEDARLLSAVLMLAP